LKHFVGMDLHSNNTQVGIINQADRKVINQKLPNNLDLILAFLEPYRETVSGIVVESTFNWYWLVDGLIDAGYKVHLANPCAIQIYNGLKYSNDSHDAYFLAKLLMLGILPEGYIFPKKERHLRDLARKRLMMVQNRTQHILSLKSMVARNLGYSMGAYEVKTMSPSKLGSIFDDQHLILAGKAHVETIQGLTSVINELEQEVLDNMNLKPEFSKLLTVPGLGKIIGLTIALETGDIKRFKKVGNYASYCRCVESKRYSNGKAKGQNNRKNGNKYLAWAYMELAHKMKRYCPEAKAFFEKKARQRNKMVAAKALAHKASRACYHIMAEQADFDVSRIFGRPKNHNKGGGSEPTEGLD